MGRNNIIAVSSGVAVLTAIAFITGGTSTVEVIDTAVNITADAAYIAAGVIPSQEVQQIHPTQQDKPVESSPYLSSFREEIFPVSEQPVQTTPSAQTTEPSPDAPKRGMVISLNINDFDDGLDYTATGSADGNIYRQHRGRSSGTDHITLESGAQVRNCTFHTASQLEEEGALLPDLRLENTSEPQVLIIHTHTTESFDPYQREYYDESFPCNSRDSEHNMVAVGKVLARTIAQNGISVVHDGTIHDYPNYTGAYDRSEATIRSLLEKYPSIKIIIDLHRDAMAEADGSRIAPITEIGGRNAAQFMIIAGCDDGRFGNMPDYLQNYRLACLFQNNCEQLYTELARPILFDYRNYNQHISTGSLLIEVGSHGNSLDEALYTAELLGNGISAALWEITE